MRDFEINNQFAKTNQPFEICVSDPSHHYATAKPSTTKNIMTAPSMFAFYDSDGRPTSPIEVSN